MYFSLACPVRTLEFIEHGMYDSLIIYKNEIFQIFQVNYFSFEQEKVLPKKDAQALKSYLRIVMKL